jgi:hypothetical protein
MNFNYFGIDADPPKRTQLILLLSNGTMVLGTSHHPGAVAWINPTRDLLKGRCQEILRGLPELRMVSCITSSPILTEELATAVRHYREDALSSFTDLIRCLDIKAHNGIPCVPHLHI